MKKWALNRRGLLIFGGVFLFGVPAAAVFGGGLVSGGYLGALPTTYFAGETCFPPLIDKTTVGDLVEVRINPRGVLEDNNPDTYLRCQDHANENRIICHAGFPDQTIATCSDIDGPHTLPGPDDRVYMMIKPNAVPNAECEIVVEKTYGEANPSCRPPDTTGGTPACNDTNALMTLTQGPGGTTVPNNACVKLKIDDWDS